MSDHDRALRAAAPIIEWLRTADRADAITGIFEDPSLIDSIVAEYDAAIPRWLDSLLEGLPDGPMIDATAAVLEEDAEDNGNAPAHVVSETAIEAFLRSLRTGLEGEG